MICPRCHYNTLRPTRSDKDVAECGRCGVVVSRLEYVEAKRLRKIEPLQQAPPPTYSYEQWMEYMHKSGQAKCGCMHPNAAPPCYWCTDGSTQEYFVWCDENGQQPEFDNPVNKTNSQGNNSMQLNRKNFAEFFRTDFYTVGVKFFGAAGDIQAKEYTYKVHKDMEICIGDKVFVCTSNDPMLAQELKATVVSSINREPELEGSDCINYKWIVGKLQDVLAPYLENIEKDNRLKRAVTVLERKLEQINLRKSIALAMEELGDEDKNELKSLFGTELLGPAQITNGDTEAK